MLTTRAVLVTDFTVPELPQSEGDGKNPASLPHHLRDVALEGNSSRRRPWCWRTSLHRRIPTSVENGRSTTLQDIAGECGQGGVDLRSTRQSSRTSRQRVSYLRVRRVRDCRPHARRILYMILAAIVAIGDIGGIVVWLGPRHIYKDR